MLKQAGRVALCLALVTTLLGSLLPKDEVQADGSATAPQYKYKLLKDDMGTGVKLYFNNGTFYYKSQLDGGNNIAHQSMDLQTWTKIISWDTFGSSKRFRLASISFIGDRVYATGDNMSTTTFPNYTTTSYLGYMNDTSNTSASWTASAFPTGDVVLGPVLTDGSNYVIGAGNDNVIYRQASTTGYIEEKAWTSSKNITSGSRFENGVYDKVNNRFIFSDDAGSIVYSVNAGVSWNKIGLDSTSASSAISDLAQVGGTTFIAGDDGVWKLQGTTINRLLPSGSNYQAIAVDEDSNIYVLRSDGTVLMSSDNGMSWSPIAVKENDNASTYFGAMEYGDGKLLVGTDTGLYQLVAGSSIIKQPEGAQVNIGAAATFFVTASGDGLAYQWQVDTTGTGDSFTDMNGATSSSLTIHPVSRDMDGYLYRVIITDASGVPLTSDAATLTLNIVKVKVSYQPGDHGTISTASEDVEVGDRPEAVPTVTSAPGYRFTGWSSDGGVTKLSSDQLKATVITGAVTYTAYYAQLVKGDLDGSNSVSAADAQLLAKYLKGAITLNPDQFMAADFNNDGVVDEADVKAILAFVTGKG
ncbi:dockerin type I domain-containing protein [Paenibacillus sanguinis]|uniref:dockerin type I domain-containing protein n=1 Tax=Paenibacillus sanguinis TaxID=225906 RepID=UPI000372BEFC|nr:dockerin type I domain-containing protein [Paenibacillus sanguinis]